MMSTEFVSQITSNRTTDSAAEKSSSGSADQGSGKHSGRSADRSDGGAYVAASRATAELAGYSAYNTADQSAFSTGAANLLYFRFCQFSHGILPDTSPFFNGLEPSPVGSRSGL